MGSSGRETAAPAIAEHGRSSIANIAAAPDRTPVTTVGIAVPPQGTALSRQGAVTLVPPAGPRGLLPGSDRDEGASAGNACGVSSLEQQQAFRQGLPHLQWCPCMAPLAAGALLPTLDAVPAVACEVQGTSARVNPRTSAGAI